MSLIHATAIVDARAEIETTVEIGAYSVIGPHVRIGAGTKVGPHVVIDGHTTIGKDNQFFQFSSLGAAPQDKKYAGEETRLEIGDRNTVREFCTFNLGTTQDDGVTRLGDDNWIMAYVHLAHDCKVGNNTIFANNATLAGHVSVGDWVILGGGTLVHQFCQIGAHAMTAFGARISQDVPPFVMIGGMPSSPHGVNSEGLRRRGFSSTQISDIRKAYRTLYRSGLSLEEAKETLTKAAADADESKAHLVLMQNFIEASTRGLIR